MKKKRNAGANSDSRKVRPSRGVAPPAVAAANAPTKHLDLDATAYPSDPELVIGLVAPIGTQLKYFKQRLAKSLEPRSFSVRFVKLSEYAEKSLGSREDVRSETHFERYLRLMDLGNELRARSSRDDVLALFAAAGVNANRRTEEPRHFASSAIVIDQLKRPEEVHRLRRIYGDHFLLIGLYCPKDIRTKQLEFLGMDASQAETLIRRDEDDATPHGQRVAETFHLADIFVEVKGNVGDAEEGRRVDESLKRFWDLVFGTEIVTPTRSEYGMYLAHAASLRSSSLARQVGASIFSAQSELISVGANDIPVFPGGLYWGDETDEAGKLRDGRDHKLGFDESDRMKLEIVREVMPVLYRNWGGFSPEQRERSLEKVMKRLKGLRITSLTEFARAVHAEMEALSAAGRIGVSVKGATLYTTTFPCHNCAKHIVAAGIQRVVYVEPYPKSRALQMYGDSIHPVGESSSDVSGSKVAFEPFVGVAPRRFADLFGRLSHEGKAWEYKDRLTGEVMKEQIRLRVPFSPFSYVIREGFAARELTTLKEQINADRRSESSKS